MEDLRKGKIYIGNSKLKYCLSTSFAKVVLIIIILSLEFITNFFNALYILPNLNVLAKDLFRPTQPSNRIACQPIINSLLLIAKLRVQSPSQVSCLSLILLVVTCESSLGSLLSGKAFKYLNSDFSTIYEVFSGTINSTRLVSNADDSMTMFLNKNQAGVLTFSYNVMSNQTTFTIKTSNPYIIDDFLVTDSANLVGIAKLAMPDSQGNQYLVFNRSSSALDANFDGTPTSVVIFRSSPGFLKVTAAGGYIAYQIDQENRYLYVSNGTQIWKKYIDIATSSNTGIITGLTVDDANLPFPSIGLNHTFFKLLSADQYLFLACSSCLNMRGSLAFYQIGGAGTNLRNLQWWNIFGIFTKKNTTTNTTTNSTTNGTTNTQNSTDNSTANNQTVNPEPVFPERTLYPGLTNLFEIQGNFNTSFGLLGEKVFIEEQSIQANRMAKYFRIVYTSRSSVNATTWDVSLTELIVANSKIMSRTTLNIVSGLTQEEYNSLNYANGILLVPKFKDFQTSLAPQVINLCSPFTSYKSTIGACTPCKANTGASSVQGTACRSCGKMYQENDAFANSLSQVVCQEPQKHINDDDQQAGNETKPDINGTIRVYTSNESPALSGLAIGGIVAASLIFCIALVAGFVYYQFIYLPKQKKLSSPASSRKSSDTNQEDLPQRQGSEEGGPIIVEIPVRGVEEQDVRTYESEVSLIKRINKDRMMEAIVKGTLKHLGEKQEDSEAAPKDSDNTFDSHRGNSDSENPNLSHSQDASNRQQVIYQPKVDSLGNQQTQRTNCLVTVLKDISLEQQKQSQSILRSQLLRSQQPLQNSIQLVSTGLNNLQTGISDNQPFTLQTVETAQDLVRKSPLKKKKQRKDTKKEVELANTQRALILKDKIKDALVSTIGNSRMQEMKVNQSEASFEIHTSQVSSKQEIEDNESDDMYDSEDE